MKKLFTLIIAFLAINSAIAQGCLPDGIIFSMQSQINNFKTYYPGCSEIQGNVVITGKQISNLNGLNDLISIVGGLKIEDTKLRNLSGLNSLKSIGGNFTISENYQLLNFLGLDSLKIVNGNTKIFTNDSLEDFTGMENLDSIRGNLEIIANNNLNSFSGLNNLKYIGGFLNISFNNSLKHLNGLENLSIIDGSMIIYYNDNLLDFSGLERLSLINGNLVIQKNRMLWEIFDLMNLTAINGDIEIGGAMGFGNYNLHSLNGLNNIDPSTIHILLIEDNYNLFYCYIESVCAFLKISLEDAIINNNGQNCKNVESVKSKCQLVYVPELSLKTNLNVQPNPSSSRFTIHFSLENEERVKLNVMNNLGQVVATLANETLSEGEHEFNWNAEGLPAGVYFYNIQIGNQAGTGKMVLMK